MDHNKIIATCLKYLNLTFAILMIIALSFNIEIIVQTRRSLSFDDNLNTSMRNSHGGPLNFTAFYHKNKNFYETCRSCEAFSVRSMNNLCSKLSPNKCCSMELVCFFSLICKRSFRVCGKSFASWFQLYVRQQNKRFCQASQMATTCEHFCSCCCFKQKLIICFNRFCL